MQPKPSPEGQDYNVQVSLPTARVEDGQKFLMAYITTDGCSGESIRELIVTLVSTTLIDHTSKLDCLSTRSSLEACKDDKEKADAVRNNPERCSRIGDSMIRQS